MTPMVPAHVQNLDIIAAIKDGAEISVCIPDDVPNTTLLEWMKVCGHHTQKVHHSSRLLGYAIGRMMHLSGSRDNFLSDNGLKNKSELEAIIKTAYGKSRSTIWAWEPIYREMPKLTRQQLLQIPQASLELVRKVPESKRDGALDVACTVTAKEFKKFCEVEGHVEPGEVDTANIIVVGSKNQIAEIRGYLENPQVIEYVGTPHLAEILLAMIQEFKAPDSRTGWPIP